MPAMPKTKSGLLSQRQYAKLRGLSHQAVSKAIRTGRIPTVAGKIDPVAADVAWARSTRTRIDDTRHDSSSPDSLQDVSNGQEQTLDRPNLTYKIARASREVSRARREKIELELVERKLVSAEEVQTRAFEVARAMRDQLLALPARLAPVLVATKDVFECHRLLEEALMEICTGLSPEQFNGLSKGKGRRRG